MFTRPTGTPTQQALGVPLLKANNLSDLESVPTALENLGLSDATLEAAAGAYPYLYVGWDLATLRFRTMGSWDGVNWVETDGSLSDGGTNTNAPCSVWYRGRFVLSLSVPGGNGPLWNFYIGYDGKNFTLVTTIDWTVTLGAVLTYAPHLYIDDNNLLHAFVPVATTNPGTNFQCYETHPTNDAMTTWSAPVLIAGLGANIIDISVFKIAETFWAFYKNETTGYLNFASGTSYMGPFTAQTVDNFANWGTGEGGGLIRMGDKVRAYFEFVGADLGLYYSDAYDALPDGLPYGMVLAEYDFLQGVSPTVLYDLSGNGYNGALSAAAPTWGATGLTFNGSSNCIDLGNPAALNFTGDLFIIAASAPTTNGSAREHLIGKNNGSSSAGSAYQLLAPSGTGPAAAQADVFVGSTRYFIDDAISPAWASGWLVTSMIRTSGVLQIINGTRITASVAAPGVLNTIATPAVIGSRGTKDGEWFKGVIGYMVIFTRVPSPVEYTQAYNYIVNRMAERSVTLAGIGNSSNPATAAWTWKTAYSPGCPFIPRHGSIIPNPRCMAPASLASPYFVPPA